VSAMKNKLLVVCLGVGILQALAGRQVRAQLIPLLPPIASDAGDEDTPQESKTVRVIEADLAAERFDDLDQMADRYRRKKTRLAGGGWRLHQFYAALDTRQPSDEATEEHLRHIEHWIAAKPSSITARVAMAQSLHRWAWLARGTGYASTVTPTMAMLFHERIERGQKVLEDAKKLPTMCPQWYSEMMTVGLAQGWEHAKMQALFDEAMQFEPGYLYFYRDYANYLLPKWEGQHGDAEKFAQVTADKVGGEMGDLIYFEVAKVVIKRGNGGIPTGEMDWERIKRGGYAMDRLYGQSRGTTNQFALMAYEYKDAAAAAPLFNAIGDRWSPSVWKTLTYYQNARQWALGKVVKSSPAAN
jgi:hypothetical protein